MNRTTRIKLALLRILRDSQAAGGFLRTTTSLHNDVILIIRPAPTLTETMAVLQALDAERHVLGVVSGDDTKWKISDAGTLWLMEQETA